MKRDERWLQQLLDDIWDNYFADVEQPNIVRIEYGRKAKRRLGSIRLDPADNETSIITINSLFKDESIPEFIVQATIVHELSHYTHGFNSPHQRTRAHPHAGGAMRTEFEERGLLDLYQQQKRWLKENWPTVVANNFAPRKPAGSRRQPRVPKPFWFLD